MLLEIKGRKGKCRICNKESEFISDTLKVCLSCIRKKPEETKKITKNVHKKIREEFNLPGKPPKDKKGLQCKICVNECKIGKGKQGYCGLRRNINGKLETKEGILHTYYDPLPTNCCASWFCPGSKERGLSLAVFPFGCTFNCIFCQNWSHKYIERGDHIPIEQLLREAKDARCICYFGGTPEPQLPFLLKATKKILENVKLKICWEWNGTGNPNLVRKAVEYSYTTNGTIKFDLKSFDCNLHMALTGRANKRTLDNFQTIAEEYKKRDLLTATTLLIPGYIDKEEVEKIAKFISNLNTDIPYSLLGFHPDFKMIDMPITTRNQAEECYQAAKKYLNRVNIGNRHLLI
ncbi:MAG: radical SAM protein [Thermoplasmatales archaeon]|nr:MAG: radical SAM protein [Thermoplasmatales archaeon]